MRGQALLQPGEVDYTGKGEGHRLADIDLPGLAVGFESLEERLGSVLLIHFVAGLFTTSPEDVAAVQNDRFMKVWEGTSENQWSNTPKSRAMPLSTGSCSGCNRS